MKRRIRQQQLWTVEELKFFIQPEWMQISLEKLQQLVSSVPKPLKTAIKKKDDATQWNAFMLCYAPFVCFARIKF